MLTAPDVPTLTGLIDRARDRGIDVTVFREPDLGDEITALAFTPGDATRRLLSNLPCAGKNVTTATEAAARTREARLREMAFAMRDCDQTPGQDVLAHGASVREHYTAITEHLDGRVNLAEFSNWRVPAWLDTYRDQLRAALLSRHVMDRYLTLHDCGKPQVLEVGDDGQRRFPGHADASARVYRDTFEGDADATVEALIAGDMDIRLIRADELPEFITRPTAIAHLLAGVAEVTSNAAVFGGTGSPSFKGKWKRIDQRGRAMCKMLFPEVV